MIATSELPTLRTVYRLKAALEDRLRRVRARQVILKAELASRLLLVDSEEARELKHEAAELRAIERTTCAHLAEIEKRDTSAEQEMHEKTVAIFAQEAQRQHDRTQLQWQKIGDHRNGRLYRMAFLDVRLNIEKELGLPGIAR